MSTTPPSEDASTEGAATMGRDNSDTPQLLLDHNESEPQSQPESGPVTDLAPQRRRWPRILGIVGLVLVLLASVALAGFWYLAKNLENNVATIEGFTPPPSQAAVAAASYAPMNVLIMGSDTRANGNSTSEQAHEITGERSDTTILVHVAADRKSALAVSIPRDTMVELPKCASESGQWEVTAKFNSAFTFGGPTCTLEAVEQISGVQIDHAVVVDFLGFKHVVEAMGGVDVCLVEAVRDPDSGLDLPAGTSRVTGDQALAFVRARKNLGDGSDIDRIARQQQFISSAIRQATDAEMLFKPVTLYRMLDAVTASLTVDGGIDQLGEMASMAKSLSDLRPENIKFVTLPFYYSANDVVTNEPVANEIWTAIANDEQWPKAPVAGEQALTVPPSDISVVVANGNGIDNAATDAAAALHASGFAIASLAMADSPSYARSVVVFNPADAEAARTLAQAVPGSLGHPDPQAPVGQLKLIVGTNFTGAAAVDVPRVPQGTLEDPLPVTADQSVCAE